jgi:acyl-CoA thioester hydrolase
MEDNNDTKKKQHGYAVQYPFHSTTPVQLRFLDIDLQGHVNNSVYFTLFDLAKADYFSKANDQLMDWRHVNIIVANVNCDFLRQTFFGENVAVQTQVDLINDKSFRLVQQLINVDTSEVKCICTEIMVYFDHKTGKPQHIPQEWRDALSKFERHQL